VTDEICWMYIRYLIGEVMEKIIKRTVPVFSLVVLLLAFFCVITGFVYKTLGDWGYTCAGALVSPCNNIVPDACVIGGVKFDCQLNGVRIYRCLYTAGWCSFCTHDISACNGSCVDPFDVPMPPWSCSSTNYMSGCL
jgi:hypothetical protein